jgi:uncharacterized Zn finger protein
MVRVSIRIREGASRFDVSVQVQSIRRAVEIAADREANAAVRVSFPIDAEAFFVEEHATRTARLGRERPERVAA